MVIFKSDLSKLANSEFFEAVVAFANTEGGDLYVGVEDDGRITGAHQEHLNPTTLSAFIANNTTPPISVRTEVIEDLLPVLKISVSKSYNNVVATSAGKILRRRLKADGTPENVPMFPFELATRLSDLRLLDYTALLVQESKIDDLDPIEIERLRKLILAYNGDKTLLDLENIELLKSLGFVREIGDDVLPTIAGLLVVGKVDDKTRHLELIQSLARENDFISKSDVVQLLHVSDNRAYYLIKKLVDANVLKVVQKGHYAKYQINN